MRHHDWTARHLIALLSMVAMTSSACSSGCRGGAQAGETAVATGAQTTDMPSDSPRPQGLSLALPAAVAAPASSAPMLPLPPAEELAPERVAAGVQSALDSLSPERYSIDALETRRPQAAAAFALVRDEFAFDAYPGVLRGAWVTFAARAGNAADRALVLAQLLRASGIPVRFALGRLDDATCARLYDRVFDVPAAAAAPSSRGQGLRQRVLARASRDFNAVLASFGGTPPPITAPTRDAVLNELRAHVWIQAELEGVWTDLDPTFRDADPGQRLAEPVRTVDRLPDDMVQKVRARIVVDRLVDGHVASATVLETVWRAPDLYDRQVFLVHLPGRGSAQRSELTQALAGGTLQQTFTPAFWVSGDLVEGQPVDFGDGAEAGPAQGQSSTPGGFAGRLDSAFGAPSETKRPEPFLAEWLELQFIVDGQPAEISRRVIVDRAGDAWRARGNADPSSVRALPRNADGPVDVQAIHHLAFSGGATDLAQLADAFRAAASDTRESAGEDFGSSVWPLVLRDQAALAWSDHVITPAMNDEAAIRLFPDRPRLYIFTHLPAAAGGGLVLESDFRRNQLRGLARDASRGRGLASRKLWHGMVEGAFEHELMALTLTARDAASPASVESTSSLLDGTTVRILRADAGGDAPAGAGADARAALDAARRSGAMLAVPWRAAADGSLGWWAVDAGTGDVEAVAGRGLNSSKLTISGDVLKHVAGRGSRLMGKGPARGAHKYAKVRPAGGTERSVIYAIMSEILYPALQAVIIAAGAVAWAVIARMVMEFEP